MWKFSHTVISFIVFSYQLASTSKTSVPNAFADFVRAGVCIRNEKGKIGKRGKGENGVEYVA